MTMVEKVGKSVAAFEALIERYKVQNPVKYQMKKKELEAKLEALRTQSVEEPESEEPKKGKK